MGAQHVERVLMARWSPCAAAAQRAWRVVPAGCEGLRPLAACGACMLAPARHAGAALPCKPAVRPQRGTHGLAGGTMSRNASGAMAGAGAAATGTGTGGGAGAAAAAYAAAPFVAAGASTSAKVSATRASMVRRRAGASGDRERPAGSSPAAQRARWQGLMLRLPAVARSDRVAGEQCTAAPPLPRRPAPRNGEGQGADSWAQAGDQRPRIARAHGHTRARAQRPSPQCPLPPHLAGPGHLHAHERCAS